MQRRNKEWKNLELELQTLTREIRSKLSGIHWFVLWKSVKRNVISMVNKTVVTHEKKLHTLTQNSVLPFTSNEVISNLSTYELSDDENEILKYGLSHGLPPPFVSKTDVFMKFEMIHKFCTAEVKSDEFKPGLKAAISHLANTYVSSYRPSRNSLKKHGILKRLKMNQDIIIVRPDKGNGVVILDKQDYIKGMLNILKDTTKFRKLETDPTRLREGQLQRFLRSLKNTSFFSDGLYEKLYPTGSQPARMYGLPKLHKVKAGCTSVPFRPIVSSIGTYNYNLAKHLCSLLSPHLPMDHCSKDTFSFVEDVNQVRFNSCFMVSFDVESLFTNIPLDETIKLAVNLILKVNKKVGIGEKDLTKLFEFATKQTHFSFNDVMYDQIDGVAMGSPLGPVLANLFMGSHESKWLRDEKASEVLFYRRYVDDIFCVFESESQVEDFFAFINAQHRNIRFTCEKEVDGKLPFLDVLLELTNDMKFHTSTYHKKTYTGLLTNYFSFTSSKYKAGLIKTLIDRAFKINNSWLGFHKDCQDITFTLQKNSFPRWLIDKFVTRFVDSKMCTETPATQPEGPPQRYFKLPFIGKFSSLAQSKLNNIIKKHCKDSVSVKLVFTPFKIGSLFSLKDSVNPLNKSHVVYKFSCAGCNASYIGETTRHFSTRVKEHLETDKTSSVYRHLHVHSLPCKDACDESCFSLLDYANTDHQLRIKEGMYIGWNQPSLNRKIKCYIMSITV